MKVLDSETITLKSSGGHAVSAIRSLNKFGGKSFAAEITFKHNPLSCSAGGNYYAYRN